jgi:hypothetical protein
MQEKAGTYTTTETHLVTLVHILTMNIQDLTHLRWVLPWTATPFTDDTFLQKNMRTVSKPISMPATDTTMEIMVITIMDSNTRILTLTRLGQNGALDQVFAGTEISPPLITSGKQRMIKSTMIALNQLEVAINLGWTLTQINSVLVALRQSTMLIQMMA